MVLSNKIKCHRKVGTMEIHCGPARRHGTSRPFVQKWQWGLPVLREALGQGAGVSLTRFAESLQLLVPLPNLCCLASLFASMQLAYRVVEHCLPFSI